MTLRQLTCFAAIATIICVTPTDAGADPTSGWNQWRGPFRDGRVQGADWPDSLSGLEPVWRVELGKSYSGPIVVGGRVFVTESSEGREIVRALDSESGDELWVSSWAGQGSVPFFARANGDWIRSTPAHDGEALYVGGMEEVLVKLDAATGRELWRVDFPERFGSAVPDFGFVSSPLVEGDHVYVQAANSIVKLERATGDTVWRALAGAGEIMESGAFSSPVLVDLAGRRQLVTQTRTTLWGLDPDAGAVLWSHDVPSFRGMNILTPVVAGDGILTSTYKNRTFYYEVASLPSGWEVGERWTHKAQAYMSSPVVIDGHAYLHLGNGRLTCVELATGVETWTSQPLGKYWSIAVQGQKLLALDEAGELRLLRANPERMELLDTAEVGRQPTWGHIAVSGDQIFVRELEAISAWRWSEDRAEKTAP